MQLSDLITLLFILEIAFAFSIGVTCILFSCSLLKAINDDTAESYNQRPDGMLPPSKSVEKLAINDKNRKQQKLNDINNIIENGYDIINEYDVDVEEVDTEFELDNDKTLASAIHSFLNYLK